MSRRHTSEKRTVYSDKKYNSILITRFINNLMKDGKKSLAEKLLYSALNIIDIKYHVNSFDIFNNAMNNVKPYLEVISIRVGGSNYQVPSPVDERRGYTLAIRWIINFAIKRSAKSMDIKIADELFDASNNNGGAYKKKKEVEKIAEANKAFAHFSPKKI